MLLEMWCEYTKVRYFLFLSLAGLRGPCRMTMNSPMTQGTDILSCIYKTYTRTQAICRKLELIINKSFVF